MPMLQPFAVSDSRLLVALDSGFTLFDVKREGDEWKAEEVWVSNRIRPGFNDFVADKGKIFGLDDGILCALDLETGERLWKKGRYGHGQVLLLPDQNLLLVQGARGEVLLDRRERRPARGAWQVHRDRGQDVEPPGFGRQSACSSATARKSPATSCRRRTEAGRRPY